jgi:hypothetical protein
MWHKTASGLYLVDNLYYDGAWRYREASLGSFIEIASGLFTFSTAPSGTTPGDIATTTERMRITSTGMGVGIVPAVQFHVEGEARVQGAEATAGILGLYADNGDDNADRWRMVAGTSSYFTVEYFSTGTWVPRITLNAGPPLLAGVYGNTTASAANMYVANTDELFRSTSSRKYKTNIRELSDMWGTLFVNKLQPVLFNSLCESDPKEQDYIGFIAEDLDTLGAKPFVSYDTDGKPENVQYDRLTTVLVKAIQEMDKRIGKLEKM